MPWCVGFEPVEDAVAQVLILGTLPSAESLRLNEYYAKKANSFWRIMGDLVGAIPEMAYQNRLRILKENGIALWDVCLSAERAGSVDANILQSSVVPNDFESFLHTHNRIQQICLNGQPAERMFRRRVRTDISRSRCEVLPSTSPAHAKLTYREKLACWRASLGKVVDFAKSHAAT